MPILRTPAEIKGLLGRVKTIAVVGLSGNPDRDSYRVSQFMKERGCRVIPVNPKEKEILGERVYPSLADLPPDLRGAVDLVNVFRKSEDALAVTHEAVAAKLPAIWFQLGVATPEAIAEANRAGLTVVADSCLMVAHRALLKQR